MNFVKILTVFIFNLFLLQTISYAAETSSIGSVSGAINPDVLVPQGSTPVKKNPVPPPQTQRITCKSAGANQCDCIGSNNFYTRSRTNTPPHYFKTCDEAARFIQNQFPGY